MTFRRRCLLALLVAPTSSAWVQYTRGITSCTRRSTTTTTTTRLFMSPINLLSVDKCLQLAGDSDAVFVDGTWFHKGNRNGREEFQEGPRIRNARHVDISDIATTTEMFPLLNPKNLHNMLPTADLWACTMDELDIDNDNHVIIYGKEGTLFAPRLAFMFAHYGHSGDVSLMQGSLEEWMKQGGPVDTLPTTVPTAREILFRAKNKRPSYECHVQNNVVDFYQMKDIVDKNEAVIIDPRGSSFQKGHVPGAKHVPYSSLTVDESSLKLKPRDELLEIFAKAGVDINTTKDIVASCGSGVSACSIILALQKCGRDDDKNTLLYDGSWQEWKQDPTTPKVIPPSTNE